MATPPDFKSLEKNIKAKSLGFSSIKARSVRGAANSVGNLPRPTPTNTPTVSVTPTLTPTPSITPTYTPTVSPTVTRTLTPTPTNTPTHSPTPTVTPTITPTTSPTPVPLANSYSVTQGTNPFIAGDIVVTNAASNFVFYWNGDDQAFAVLPCTISVYIDNVLVCSFMANPERFGLDASTGAAFAIEVPYFPGRKFYGNFDGSNSSTGPGLASIYRFDSSRP